ncbi:hypothetical protein D7M11_07795 [Paenibacillus ginsengarvi]|uniref:Uncharacterized protein n=1 Tax=Paenibacillus ginsengarvi TaxID=400777 RepID=A0A3B0CMT4_9BACL|nr:hypothetical protein D7M11_07795 [Paenibacillus ginsengarvi]
MQAGCRNIRLPTSGSAPLQSGADQGRVTTSVVARLFYFMYNTNENRFVFYPNRFFLFLPVWPASPYTEIGVR